MADDLAQLLVLLHENGHRWRTLRAEGEEWVDEARAAEAFRRSTRPGSVFTLRGAPGPADRDPVWKAWLQPDQRYWVAPLPPPGPLGVVVEWPGQDLAETRVDLDGAAIVAAAAQAEELWP